ncbi:MAG: hypothetical protein GWP06_05565, partial [Actinobacteria bacterium]|nr:hypothetical protein [Actinomycetota bacterium]
MDSLTRSLIEYIKETAPKDQRFLDLSFDLNMNVFLLRQDRTDMTCQQIFKRFCNIFAEKMKINQAILFLSYAPLVKKEVIYWGCSRENCCDINICFEQSPLHFPQYRQIKNMDNSFEDQEQYLFRLPIVTGKSQYSIEWGSIFFLTQEVDGILKNVKSLRLFSVFLADRLVRFYHAKVIKYLNSAKKLPSREIKQIIRTTLLGMSKTLNCDYSIGLVLNRSYSEAEGGKSKKGEPKQTFEVVTEYLIGKKSSTPQRSLSTGLWIEEDEGLISAVISLWRKDKSLAQQGLTFHQIENSQSRYYCLELKKEFSSLQGFVGESAEKTLFYTALVNEDILLGFIKLSYREKIVYGDFERSLATQYCRFLAVRIRNSFIYSLNVDQSRFLFEIKALFEKADRLKIQNFDDIGYIFKKLSELIVDITGIETISIGYISKDSNGEQVIRFPHPIGWSEDACQRFKEISMKTGLAGLAVRIKRRIYLAPVEEPIDSSGPMPSVYVNEQEPYFIDIRKHPELAGHPEYKQLSSYYEKVNDEKVYADHVFLIEYKKLVLGVIDVEVTKKNWDRFIGIGYLYFFQTLANMLALLFYRVRLAEEHNRVVNAVKWLSDAVFMSPQAVIKSILGMLRSIYNVQKAKIILCDIYKNPIEIKPFTGKFEYMFLGYHPSVVKKLTSAASIIDKDNFFLNE